MKKWLKNLFVAIFGTNSQLATIIISMIPIIELRGAIPFGSAVSLWGENALPVWQSFLYSVLGCSIVCVILTFLFWPIFKWLKQTKVFKVNIDEYPKELGDEILDIPSLDDLNDKKKLQKVFKKE